MNAAELMRIKYRPKKSFRTYGGMQAEELIRSLYHKNICVHCDGFESTHAHYHPDHTFQGGK